MKSLVCGMPVGPDEERGIKFAINCIDLSLKTSSSQVSTKWKLILDPLIDNDVNRQRFINLFGDRVSFVSLSAKNTVKRSNNKCGDIHGSLLDALVESSDSEYFCIHDSDIVFLKKCWNEYLVQLFESNSDLIAIGPESPLSDGWRKVPTSMILAFRTNEFRELGIVLNKSTSSLRKFPSAGISRNETVTVDRNNQKYWNRDIGTRVYLETGYELVPALVDSGKSWITLKTVMGENNTQWYYDLDNKLFASHMTGSFVRSWNSNVRKIWSERIEREINEL